MKTEIHENEARADFLDASVDLTPAMLNQIYRDAEMLRSEALYNGTMSACRAARKAMVTVLRVFFTSGARRHA